MQHKIRLPDIDNRLPNIQLKERHCIALFFIFLNVCMVFIASQIPHDSFSHFACIHFVRYSEVMRHEPMGSSYSLPMHPSHQVISTPRNFLTFS